MVDIASAVMATTVSPLVCGVLADVIVIVPDVLTFTQTRTHSSQGQGVANDHACQSCVFRSSPEVERFRFPPEPLGFHGIRISCPLRTIATVTVNAKRTSSFRTTALVMNVATGWLKGSIYYSSGADLQTVATFILQFPG